MATIQKVDARSLRELVESSDGAVVVDFSADWCAPCRALGPVVAGLEESYGVRVVKVDVDEEPEVDAEFGVRSIPTLVLVDKGEERARSVGFATPIQLAARLGLTGPWD